tara:strand:- start:569 stop:670 length:102 start_codon:yes stop_codon:yes gene_type:complete
MRYRELEVSGVPACLSNKVIGRNADDLRYGEMA